LRDRVPKIGRAKEAAFAALAVLLAVAGVALAVVLAGEPAEPRPGTSATGASRTGRTSFLARLIPPGEASRRGRPVAASVSRLARQLSLERKVAQLFLLGFQGQDLTAPIFERLRELDIGGLVIDTQNYTSPDQLSSMTGEARVIAADERHVEPWVMAPQEGGELNAFADLPPASAPATLGSNAQAFREAKLAAGDLGRLGINGVLAPVVDVAPPSSAALGDRAYSDAPREVAAYGSAVIDAYRRAHVLTAAAHFPGLGSATADTRLGVAQVGSSLEMLRERDLLPFRAAIRAGAPAVTVGHGLYATDDFVTPASLSHVLTTDVLRRELGFQGIAITDDLADPPITALASIPSAAVEAIMAGADLLYISGPEEQQAAAYAAVLDAVRRGEISRRRLDEALLRNLAVKHDYRLVE
jgi:beta-N-acetylhexosaminidase